MQSFLRNIVFTVLFLLIIISAIKCGSSEEQKKKTSEINIQGYKNLDSNVRYVGIYKCRQCHYDKYETFIETGMGKSFDRATKQKSSAKFDSHSVVYDKFSDLSYLPFWAGDTMKIIEFRLEGKDTVHKRIETVDYIIGSGQHTNSHIYNTNGYLHQMPMTYYTQIGKWDLPPGFEAGFNSRFGRKIGLECMSCHNALPDFKFGSENKFDEVPTGISCERCHGPGEVHVKEKIAGIIVDTSKYIDYSIVNPSKLPIDLQFDVCQRCHLQGNSVLKEGKSFLDFRPGMKLSDIETVFLPKYQGADEDFIMASHADRLKQSRCFISTSAKIQESTLKPYKNGLTCISCHNPHVSSKVTGKDVFNNACKKCHTNPSKETCTEKREVRNQKKDNCVSCHMPKSGAVDIPHVTVTDHYIRKPVKKTDMEGVKKFLGLFAINEKNPDPKVKAEAYINQFEKFDHNTFLLDSAKKYLKENNISNHANLVRLYFLKNDYKKIVSLNSNHLLTKAERSYDNRDAWTCYRVAEAMQNIGKSIEAYPFYKKAVELSPFNMEFQNKLAGNLVTQNKKKDAESIYERMTIENPKFAPAWCNLGFIYLQNGNMKKAEEYYDKAIALDPDYEQALLNKAGLLLYQNKQKEAISIVKKILKRNPNNAQALAIQMRFTKS